MILPTLQPETQAPLPSALQRLSQLLMQHKIMDQQPVSMPQNNGQPSQGNDSAPPPDSHGLLSNLFTQGAANATGLPWLAGGSNTNAMSTLANLFKV